MNGNSSLKTSKKIIFRANGSFADHNHLLVIRPRIQASVDQSHSFNT